MLAGAGLMMASCSQDEIDAPVKGDGNFTVTVKLPGDLTTRALGSGTVANDLQVAIFSADGKFLENKEFSFNGALQTDVTLDLVPGTSYYLAFFAQSPDSKEVYNWNPANGEFTVAYDKMNTAGNNADDYDCFYELLPTGVVGSKEMETSVTLYRPIAKINWGSSDFNSTLVQNALGENYANAYATLTADLYTSFNLLQKDVIAESVVEDVKIGAFTPATTEAFTVNGYKYVGMQYVLAPKESENFELTLNVANADVASGGNPSTDYTFSVSNAPLQANFQTNIYGALFTDQYSFTVKKDPTWGTPANNIAMPWDGKTEEPPTMNADGDYEIMNPAQWVGLGSVTRATSGSFSGNVVLGANLDFGGYEVPALMFSGEIDGQGFTLSNLQLSIYAGYAAGLLGTEQMEGSITVKDLTVSNVTAVNHTYGSDVWGYTGTIIGAVQSMNVTLDNVNVINTNLNGIQSVGGLIGFVSSGSTVNITNCSVSGSNITNMPYVNESGYVAGMVGRPAGTVTIGEGNSVSNTTIDAYWATRRGAESIAEVVGGQTLSNVEVTDVNITKTEIKNNDQVATSDQDLSNALSSATEGSTIYVTAGDYGSFPSAANLASGVTIDCEEGTVFTEKNSSVNLNGATVKGATFNFTTRTSNDGSVKGTINANFENCTFEGGNGVRWTYAGAEEITFTNCDFAGTAIYAFHIDGLASGVSSSTLVFNECNFNGFLAIAGAVNSEYNSCEFTINETSKYGGGNFWGSASFSDCNFYLPNPTQQFQYIALATAGKTYSFTDCYNEGAPITTSFPFDASTGVTVTCNGESKTF